MIFVLAVLICVQFIFIFFKKRRGGRIRGPPLEKVAEDGWIPTILKVSFGIVMKGLPKVFNLRRNWRACVRGSKKKTFGRKNNVLPLRPTDLACVVLCFPWARFLGFLLFVLKKKGSNVKKRTKEEEIEKGDYGPPTRKIFLRFCQNWTNRHLITFQRMVQWCVWRFDSRLWDVGDSSDCSKCCTVFRTLALASFFALLIFVQWVRCHVCMSTHMKSGHYWDSYSLSLPSSLPFPTPPPPSLSLSLSLSKVLPLQEVLTEVRARREDPPESWQLDHSRQGERWRGEAVGRTQRHR